MDELAKRRLLNTELEIQELLENRGANYVGEPFLYFHVKNTNLIKPAIINLLAGGKIEHTSFRLPDSLSKTTYAKMYRLRIQWLQNY